MIRSELCKVANDMSPATFNTHRRNGDLPFGLLQAEKHDAGGRTWSRFELHHAMLLIAAQTLASGQGVGWSEAAAILRASVGVTHVGMEPGGLVENLRRSTIHCARIEFSREDGSTSELHPRFKIMRGTLSEIVGSVERGVSRFNELQQLPFERVTVCSFVSVNLSQAWRVAAERAEALKIDFDADWEDGLPVGRLDNE